MCVIYDFIFFAQGLGRSKKIAKRLAAARMCQKLQEISMEGGQLCDEEGNLEVIIMLTNGFKANLYGIDRSVCFASS